MVLTLAAVYSGQNQDVRHNFREGVMYSRGSAAKHRSRSLPAVASVVTVDGRWDVDLWEVGEGACFRIAADGQLAALGWEAERCRETSWGGCYVSVRLHQHMFNNVRDSKASEGESVPSQALRICRCSAQFEIRVGYSSNFLLLLLLTQAVNRG